MLPESFQSPECRFIVNKLKKATQPFTFGCAEIRIQRIVDINV